MFQTILGDYKDNESITNYIWELLVVDSIETIMDQATSEQEPIQWLHQDFIDPVKYSGRHYQDINSEAMVYIQYGCLNQEHNLSDRNRGWEQNLGSSYPV